MDIVLFGFPRRPTSETDPSLESTSTEFEEKTLPDDEDLGHWTLQHQRFPLHRCSMKTSVVDLKAEFIGTRGPELRRMLKLGLPPIVFWLIWWVSRTTYWAKPEPYGLDLVEFFCGVGRIVDEYTQHGRAAYAYDIKHGPDENICDHGGFLKALWLVLRLNPGSLAWFGTVCSTWVFMSRWTTGRSAYKPLGDNTACVQEANMMVSQAVLLKHLAQCRGVCWLLEQPASSLMGLHPRLKEMQGLTQVHTWMGMFGADTAKPTLIYGIGDWFHGLHRVLKRGNLSLQKQRKRCPEESKVAKP